MNDSVRAERRQSRRRRWRQSAKLDAVKAKLAELGGAAESHTVTDEALEEANAAASSDEA